MNRLLFVCTGNYYRSRMAEEIFNYRARHLGLDWQADSAGLRSDMPASPNVGPISKLAVKMLEKGEYPITSRERWPRSIDEKDLKSHDIVICLNRPEHEPMIREQFADFADDVVYWEVADVEELAPEIAFQLIIFGIGQLIFLLNAPQSHMIVPDHTYPL